MRHRGCNFLYTPAFSRLGPAGQSGIALVCGFGALLFAVPHLASAQNASPSRDLFAAPLVTATDHPAKLPPASEITVEGLVSYGNYRIFASGENCKI